MINSYVYKNYHMENTDIEIFIHALYFYLFMRNKRISVKVTIIKSKKLEFQKYFKKNPLLFVTIFPNLLLLCIKIRFELFT